jgi:hypothetical protein
METFLIIAQVVIVLAIVGGAIATMSHRWQSKFSRFTLAQVFFTFGLICGALAVFTQYGNAYQVGAQDVFADAGFYLLLGILSILGAIYLKSDKR